MWEPISAWGCKRLKVNLIGSQELWSPIVIAGTNQSNSVNHVWVGACTGLPLHVARVSQLSSQCGWYKGPV